MESYEKVATGLILAAMMATAGLLTYVWANPEPVTFDRSGGLLSTFSNRGQVFDFLRSSNNLAGRNMTADQDSQRDS